MLLGIENKELPLIKFDIIADGGFRQEDTAKTAVANMLAKMLTQGTKNKTAAELENAIKQLGSTLLEPQVQRK